MKTYLSLNEMTKAVANIANGIRTLQNYEKCNTKIIRRMIKTFDFTKFYVHINKKTGEIFFSLAIREDKDWLSISIIQYKMNNEFSCEIL